MSILFPQTIWAVPLKGDPRLLTTAHTIITNENETWRIHTLVDEEIAGLEKMLKLIFLVLKKPT
jgi:hypothetical protein